MLSFFCFIICETFSVNGLFETPKILLDTRRKALGTLNSIIFYFSLVTTLVWSMNYSNTNIENMIKLRKQMNSDIYISMVRLKKTLSQKSEINEN